MMRLAGLLLYACVAAVALPATAAAQAGDSVTGTATFTHVVQGPLSVTFDVHSGPSGESPAGSLVINTTGSRFDVICLSVSGSRAVLGFPGLTPNDQLFVVVEDNGSPGVGLDTISNSFTGPSGPCSDPPPVTTVFVITSGDIRVVDAQPSPTTREQCKNGDWRQFGIFKNQGDCVSFVATGGRNPATGGQP
jgi:hypothetical protein